MKHYHIFQNNKNFLGRMALFYIFTKPSMSSLIEDSWPFASALNHFCYVIEGLLENSTALYIHKRTRAIEKNNILMFLWT